MLDLLLDAGKAGISVHIDSYLYHFVGSRDLVIHNVLSGRESPDIFPHQGECAGNGLKSMNAPVEIEAYGKIDAEVPSIRFDIEKGSLIRH